MCGLLQYQNSVVIKPCDVLFHVKILLKKDHLGHIIWLQSCDILKWNFDLWSQLIGLHTV